ncbi:MAG TPA: right-handed parallel beta-helix repeat-containing protein [Pyrinomonadaceae bacterium]|nr:right-handed parallel beta-helix repeat-containing protein [Pyrinomonadaceae bacterium]
MKRFLFYIMIVGSCAVSAAAQRQQGRVVVANNYPGQDLGAKINAADKALGNQPGEIVVRNGGTITTQIIISSDHRLRFDPGTYVTKTTNTPILMKPRSSLTGSGWDHSIIVESTAPNQFTVISAYNNSIRNGSADSDLVIRDVQIKGANPGFSSTPQAISLGNCSNCTVDKVWINGTRSIGVQLGGSAQYGHFADNSRVTNCLFTRVASQNLALVNGRNIVFEGNRFLSPGQAGGPGSTNIDLEPNGSTDRIQNVTIRNNFIDARESEVPTSGNGILVQASTGTTLVGSILVEQNTIIGGSNQGTITNKVSNGIYVFGTTMRDVTIRNNTITRTGQSGIRIEGDRIVVENNKLTDVGGGGLPGFLVIASNSRIVNNTFTYTGQGPTDARMVIAAASRNNVIENNRGFDLAREGQEDR